MSNWIQQIFDTDAFPPRWTCGSWSEVHGWTHIIADSAIFGAYVVIPFTLAYFVRRRTDVPFPKVFWLFSAFIMFCGLTHLIEATIFWKPWYRLSAVIKVGTAFVSWGTVAAMLPEIPRALRFRSPTELEAEVEHRTEQLADAIHRLQDKNNELEQFIYTISHDLKSPLVTARGFLGALQEDLRPVTPPKILDSIERIDRATLRMGDLLDDLLALSQIGRVRNQPEWIDVEAMVGELAKGLVPPPEGQSRQVKIDSALPAVHADPVRMRQVFDNLIANAIKYGTSDDQPVVSITGTQTETHCVYHIIDHGQGVPKAMKDRIFLPFERLATDAEGTGVGLAIVARIVAVCGGSVDVEETSGGGATFIVSIPKPMAEAE